MTLCEEMMSDGLPRFWSTSSNMKLLLKVTASPIQTGTLTLKSSFCSSWVGLLLLIVFLQNSNLHHLEDGGVRSSEYLLGSRMHVFVNGSKEGAKQSNTITLPLLCLTVGLILFTWKNDPNVRGTDLPENSTLS